MRACSAFSIAVASIAGLLAGLAPALKATKPNLTAELKGDRRSMSSGSRRWTLRDALLVAQTAVTLVLLVAAGLLTRSILKAQQVDLGFTAGGLAVLGTEVGLIGYDEAKADALYDRAIERVRALPGVQSVAGTVRQPLAINYNRNSIFFPDRQQPGDRGLPDRRDVGGRLRTSPHSASRFCTAATSAPPIRRRRRRSRSSTNRSCAGTGPGRMRSAGASACRRSTVPSTRSSASSRTTRSTRSANVQRPTSTTPWGNVSSRARS